jgi:energy-coupling factor transporter ATP-binding protein EcfA2
MMLGLDAGILAKSAMRYFWKIANRVFVANAGKIFWESSGKSFR